MTKQQKLYNHAYHGNNTSNLDFVLELAIITKKLNYKSHFLKWQLRIFWIKEKSESIV
jgi:hypothetical protein